MLNFGNDVQGIKECSACRHGVRLVGKQVGFKRRSWHVCCLRVKGCYFHAYGKGGGDVRYSWRTDMQAVLAYKWACVGKG